MGSLADRWRGFWRGIRARAKAATAPGKFLCDSCKYDYRGACRRPERPNATLCEDYERRV